MLLFLLTGCNNKKNEDLSLQQVRNNNNQRTYPSNKMDSLQAINAIISQKTQELLDLAVLYSSEKKDTDIDSALYSQMNSYIYKPDSLTFKALLSDIDSLKPKEAHLKNLDIYKNIVNKDTLNYAKFQVNYMDKNNRILETKEKTANYILLPYPVKFKREFKFFFLNFYKPVNDSTSSGVIK